MGIVTAVWLLVVGATGFMNELAKPLFGIWQMTDVKTLLDKYKGQSTPAEKDLSSPQAAFTAAQQNLPGMTVVSIVYPGNAFGSPYHYLLWAKGKDPLSSRLFSPTLVNARSGKLETVVKMPFYLRALEVSRPLHFGDYGGMPLKVIWAIFDLIAVIMLLSGVYLWVVRRKFYRRHFEKLEETEKNQEPVIAG
ncbi:MAG: PepSY-associated TM helix domain-containing protein [Ilumatobacteraceae bacterium]